MTADHTGLTCWARLQSRCPQFVGAERRYRSRCRAAYRAVCIGSRAV